MSVVGYVWSKWEKGTKYFVSSSENNNAMDGKTYLGIFKSSF